MSFLIRSLRPVQARTSSRALYNRPVAATFHTSPARYAMSENDRGRDDQAEKIEKEKEKSVKEAEEGKGQWTPDLATRSEQDVKADHTKLTMKEMEELGEEKAKEKD